MSLKKEGSSSWGASISRASKDDGSCGSSFETRQAASQDDVSSHAATISCRCSPSPSMPSVPVAGVEEFRCRLHAGADAGRRSCGTMSPGSK